MTATGFTFSAPVTPPLPRTQAQARADITAMWARLATAAQAAS